MLLKDLKRGMSHGERKREKWEQDRELKMKLLIGLGFKFGFVSIFHFPVSRFLFLVILCNLMS